MTGAEFKALIPDTGKVYVMGYPVKSGDVQIDNDGDVLIDVEPEEDEFEDEEDEEDEEE